jgi:YidC/Oxa1 family membrane protein insertase
MGLGMFLQQKMTAVAMDPAQAKMMMFMPIMMTFMFLPMPAGLVLYWVVNSLTTIAIQKFITWHSSQNPPLSPA